MLIEKITDEELEFMEGVYDPICMAETLFHDYDRMREFDAEKFGEIRLYQIPMLSFEYTLAPDPNLNEKENFRLLEGAGSVVNLGARNYGKTKIAMVVDQCTSGLLLDGWNTAFSSIDSFHVNKVMDEVKEVYETHPIFAAGKKVVRSAPNYQITMKSGFSMVSINMNLTSRKPGQAFVGHHLKKLWIDEASYETEEVNKLRRESKWEKGCVERYSGMTNFTVHSPMGKLFESAQNQSRILNYPQFVNAAKWDDKSKQEAVEDYGSEQAPEYRVFILGEVVDEGISAFDMQRVKECYTKDDNNRIRTYAVNKKSFKLWQTLIIVDRPQSIQEMFLCADIADKGQTDIIVVGRVGEKYHYLYNITLFSLTAREQVEIFDYLIRKLNVEVAGIDATEGTGRGVYDGLVQIFPRTKILSIGFNTKVPVDYEYDDDGNKKIKDGKPIYKEDYASDWSIQRLRELFYNGRFTNMPLDYRLDKQLTSVRGVQGAKKINYHCICEDDHLFQAFQVFAVTEWLKKFLQLATSENIEFGGGCSGIARGVKDVK
jgi:hypothetical protein